MKILSRQSFKKMLLITGVISIFHIGKSNAQTDSIEINDWISTLPEKKPKMIKYVKDEDILFRDKKKLLHKEWLWSGDSTLTYLWKGYYWCKLMKADQDPYDEDRSTELFAFNYSTDTLIQVTHHQLDWSTGPIGPWQNIYFWNDQMFIMKRFDTDDPVSHEGILIVDPERHRISKEIYLEKHHWAKKLYNKDNHLYIEAQPMERKLNMLYYFEFWLPRGRSPKWDYIEVGNRWRYILDEQFNIIKKEELK